MSMSFESDFNKVVVNSDCNGEAAKRREVFLASLLTPGGMTPSDLDPQNFKPVEMQLAPDVTPNTLAALCVKAQVEIR